MATTTVTPGSSARPRLRPTEGVDTLEVADVAGWRAWLEEHGDAGRAVWLIAYHRDSGVPSVRFHEAIEHALCFGWVDSVALSRDSRSCYLRFTPRNPRSRWGPRNRQRAERMIDAGLMRPSGQALIDAARADGRWPLAAP